jgi:hypothetical protein
MKTALSLLLALMLAGYVSSANIYREDVQWTYYMPGRVNAIEVMNDSALVGAENGAYLLDWGGKVLWFHPTGAAVTAVKSSDGVFVASDDGALDRLRPDGSLVWQRHLPGYIGYADALDSDGRGTLCGSMDGFVYMLDGNGTYLWKHLVGSYVTAVKMLNDTVVAVSDRQVYFLDMEGRVRRNLDITGYIRGAVVSDKTVVVGMDDGTVDAYNLSGGLIWSRETGGYISAMEGGENVTVGTRERNLFHYLSDGSLLWELNLTSGVNALAVSGDSIVAGTLDNQVTVYSGGGLPKRYYETDGRPSVVAVIEPHLVAGTTTGRIYYARLPMRDASASLIIPAAVVLIIGAALFLMLRSWR